jgi:hypothetical protein
MNQEKINSEPINELPPVDGGNEYMVNETAAVKKVEQGSVSSAQPVSAPLNNVQDPAQGSSQQSAGQQPQTTQVSTPSIADDEDLIEKEWVDSAKRIVGQTKGDPHAQSEGINAIKTDYKKKRFNIDNELGKAS